MGENRALLDEKKRTALGSFGALTAGIGLGLLAIAGRAQASAAGEENITLSAILTQAKAIYESAKKYQDTFNKYADEANRAFEFIGKTHTLINRIQNIGEVVETQRQELGNMFKVRRKGDWTKFRIQKLDIDSMALISEIKYLSSRIGHESKKIVDAETVLTPRTEAEKEEISGRRRVMSRVSHAALQIHQSRLFHEASRQATEERRKAVDANLKLDDHTRAIAFALDSVPELLEIGRQQLRATTLGNELLTALVELQGLKRPLSTRDDYIPTESDFKTATDKSQDGDYDWAPGGRGKS